MTPVIPTAAEATSLTVPLTPESTTSTQQFSRDRSVPITMPGKQEFYWQHEWQQGERDTLASLAEGNGVLFDGDDPEDIVRWLHAPEDSESDPD